jgi:hypothetical protein
MVAPAFLAALLPSVGAFITGVIGGTNVLTANLSPALGTATTWQWQRAGVNIAGQTAQTYTQVPASDSGFELECLINGTYTARITIPAIPPVFSAAAIITAAIITGVTYTAATLSNAGSPVATLVHDLYDNGAVAVVGYISGAAYAGVVGHTMTILPRAVQGGSGVVGPTSTGFIVTSGGGVFPSFVNPIYGLSGDSHTLFTNLYAALGVGVTYTRDATTGVQTGATGSNNNLFGTPRVYPIWMSDQSFEVAARANNDTGSNFGSPAGTTSTAAMFPLVLPPVRGGTALTQTNAAIINWERFSDKGIFTHLKGLFKGALEYGGNLGHGGALTSQMRPWNTYAKTLGWNICQFLGGTNDVKPASGLTPNQAFALVKAEVDFLTGMDGSGNGMAVILLSVFPLGVSNAGATTTNPQIIGSPTDATLYSGVTQQGATYTNQYCLNYQLKQYAAANPSKVLFVDTFTPLYDTVNKVLYASMTGDDTHISGKGPPLCAAAAYATLSPYISGGSILPTSAADQGTVVNGHTRLAARGPWVGTVGGTFATGASADGAPASGTGGLPPGWVGSRLAGTGSMLCSVFDPGDGQGFKVRLIPNAATAADIFIAYPYGTSGVNFTTLGISGSDNAEYAFGCEIDWTGATAGGLGLIQVLAQSSGSGTHGTVTCGEETQTAAAPMADSGTAIVRYTGWMQLAGATTPGITAFNPQVVLKFNTASTTPPVITVRKFLILKK